MTLMCSKLPLAFLYSSKALLFLYGAKGLLLVNFRTVSVSNIFVLHPIVRVATGQGVCSPIRSGTLDTYSSELFTLLGVRWGEYSWKKGGCSCLSCVFIQVLCRHLWLSLDDEKLRWLRVHHRASIPGADPLSCVSRLGTPMQLRPQAKATKTSAKATWGLLWTLTFAYNQRE